MTDIPASLGPYSILAPIATGGMGAVYRARDTRTGREVALKVLLPHLSGDVDFVRRFRHEVQALTALKHPNIVEIVESGQINEQYFLAMEYLPGGSLLNKMQALRRTGQSMAVETALEAVRQVALALNEAHQRQIVHRDVKPSNIMDAGGNRFVLTDFGIVKGGQMTQVTQMFAAVGTPDYMSPEQAMGKTVDGRSDIYSLGVVLYEMLAGSPPFKAENTPALLYKQVHELPPDVRTFRAEVSDRVKRLVDRMMAKKPEDRPQSAAQVAMAIQRIQQGDASQTAITPVGGVRAFPKALAALIGVAALAVIGLGAWAVAGNSGSGSGATATTAPPEAVTSAPGASQTTSAPRPSVTPIPTLAGTARPGALAATPTLLVPTDTPVPPTATSAPLPTVTRAPTATAAPTWTAVPTIVPTAPPSATSAPVATSSGGGIIFRPTLVVISPPLILLPTATPKPLIIATVPIKIITTVKLP